MSTKTQALASEQEARDVAEAARETEWQHPSFVRELFLGRFRLDLIHPHPERDGPGRAGARRRRSSTKLRAFLERYDADEVDRTGEIPEHHVQELRDMGAFGIKIPREYGGLGLSQMTYIRAMELVTSKCGSLDGAALRQPVDRRAAAAQAVRHRGAEEEVLPAPRARAASARSRSPRCNAGSDPANMTTTATPTDDGHYVINGEKLWCTNGTRADLFVVMARTPDRSAAQRQDAEADHGLHRRSRAARRRGGAAAALHGPQGDRERRHPVHQRQGARRRTSSGAKARASSSRSSR